MHFKIACTKLPFWHFRTGFFLYRLIVQKTFIVTYQHLGLDLFESLKNNTYNNDDRCSSEGYVSTKHSVEEDRDHTHDDQPNCTDKYDVVQNPAKIFCGRLTRSNSWNEATLAFHIIGNLNRVKRDRRIKIRKEYDKHNVQHQTK